MVRDWGGSSLARMGRVIPAFGVGGLVNARVRKETMLKSGGSKEGLGLERSPIRPLINPYGRAILGGLNAFSEHACGFS